MHEYLQDLYRRSGIILGGGEGFGIKFTSATFAFITRNEKNVATMKQTGPNAVTVQALAIGKIYILDLGEAIEYLRGIAEKNSKLISEMEEVYRQACALVS